MTHRSTLRLAVGDGRKDPKAAEELSTGEVDGEVPGVNVVLLSLLGDPTASRNVEDVRVVAEESVESELSPELIDVGDSHGDEGCSPKARARPKPGPFPTADPDKRSLLCTSEEIANTLSRTVA